ncbi:RNA-binding protein, putative [Plasmodium gallinaceum]|uniref:RNA-binding protein, putative n=1 Tax=Plasmodium gallinaceum TaxID=5849 RepID=A0A1J1GXN8_PLAGA|nr:RNA-binding protein, putative [Plasmodium gallinaceum]CRG97256.1 RNA-binding protein, putative [Plasmodium gallinaceum]
MFFHMLKEKKVIIPKKYFKKNIHIPFINNGKFFKIVRSFTEYNIKEKINLPRLKLRGLPFDASEEEIRNFFKNFQLSKQGYPIHIIKGAKNKPTGHAYVYFDDEEEARNACKTLNRKFLRDRYVEIYIDYIFNHNLTPIKDHVTTLMRDRYKKDNQ